MTERFRHLPIFICVAVLGTMFALQVATARQESQTVDEGVHLSAGLSYWRTRDFRLNPEHPPLIKLLAAVPLLFSRVDLPTGDRSWATWNQYAFGDVFLYKNSLDPQTILFLGRLPMMLLSVLLGWLIFTTSRTMFGPWGGVLSVVLYAFDPGFIAHGHYVTTDLGFSLFAFWTIVRLVKLLDRPSRRNAVWFGLTFIGAGLSKFSSLAFLASLLVVFALFRLRRPADPAFTFRRVVRSTLIALPFAAVLVWAVYGFDVRRRADDPRIAQLYAQRADYLSKNDPATLSPLYRFILFTVGDTNAQSGSWLERTSQWPIPGYAFFRGLITVVGHSIGGQEAYLLGEYRDTGWWYFFPIAFLTKTPLPTLLCAFGVIIIVIGAIHRQWRTQRSWRRLLETGTTNWFFFTGVPLVFFGISMMSHLNLGWRHIMPVYPFLFVLIGALASPLIVPWLRRRYWVPIGMGLSMIAIQLMTYPNEIGYFNAAAGGSRNGPNILLDSSLDWGQDVYKLGPYLRQHQLESIPFIGYGRVPAERYLTPTHLPTSAEVRAGKTVHGYVAIGVGQLMREDREYDWLQAYTPVDILGSGVYVYRLP